MSLIHADSQAAVKYKLDLFLTPLTETAIEKGQWLEYHPITNIRNGNPIEFSISESGEDYIHLSATHLHLKVKILKDNAKLGETDNVAPVNLLLYSLSSHEDVSLKRRLISASRNLYPFRSYIETLLNYGSDYKKSFPTCESFYKDSASCFDKTAPAWVNEGFKKPASLIEKSKVIDLIGNLQSDIFYQDRLLLNVVDLKVKLIRSKPEFCLITPANGNYSVIFEHASSFVRKVKVSPGVLLGHSKALQSTTARYPIDRILSKMYSISKGSFSFSQYKVFLLQMPKRLIITCVDNDAFNGTYSSNPFHFKYNNLNFLGAYVDGNPISSKPLESDYSNGQSIRTFNSLLVGSGKLASNKGIYINREEFVQGYALYAFDLTLDLCDGSHLNLVNQGNLSIKLKFSNALEKTISVLVYAEFQNMIEITNSRNVLCDFSI
ncbi:Uncharacterized protein F54H12.2 [Araneus ventricosus]|uniref:Uncharacterized protein F54H12.2 n=1 Tax=Araneus ventricosus TaxID=182803 RepID=A0A4Y2ML34_ARAVE|nr:Uncharacterized protein F54H12.2 [Araneus ventricosus]